MIEIIYIAIICVCIIDLSGIIQSIEEMLKKWLKIQKGEIKIPKPFSCSLCMCFWTGLIYLLCTGQFTFFMIAYVLIISLLTPEIKDLLLTIKDLINYILNLIHNKLN